jgi:hypothetical protein
MASRAEHYRELARESLEVAATLPDGKLRDSMLQMAETWDRLAQEQQQDQAQQQR